MQLFFILYGRTWPVCLMYFLHIIDKLIGILHALYLLTHFLPFLGCALFIYLAQYATFIIGCLKRFESCHVFTYVGKREPFFSCSYCHFFLWCTDLSSVLYLTAVLVHLLQEYHCCTRCFELWPIFFPDLSKWYQYTTQQRDSIQCKENLNKLSPTYLIKLNLIQIITSVPIHHHKILLLVLQIQYLHIHIHKWSTS